jgi:hypothetical protein
MHARYKTTPEKRELVRVFGAAGMLQRDIATEVGLNVATVSNIQTELGLSMKNMEPIPEEIEREILRLYREDHLGSRRIATKLNVPQHRVEIILQTHNLKPRPGQPGCVYAVPAQIKTAMRREYRSFEKRIARKYNLSDVWTRRFLRRRKA